MDYNGLKMVNICILMKNMDYNGLKMVNICILMKKYIMPIIIHCKVSALQAIEFRSKLGFKHHDIALSKEQSVILKIMKTFSNKKKRYHNILFYATKSIHTFLNIN